MSNLDTETIGILLGDAIEDRRSFQNSNPTVDFKCNKEEIIIVNAYLRQVSEPLC